MLAVECAEEVSEVVRQPILLLVDVQLLEVIDQLLLEAVAIVLHLTDLFQVLRQATANLLHALLFVRIHLTKQIADDADLLLKDTAEHGALLRAEVDQPRDGLADSAVHRLPFRLTHLAGLTAHRLGQPEQRSEPVRRLGHAEATRQLVNLLVVTRDGRRIDPRGGIPADVFHVNVQIHFATLQTLQQLVA